MLRRLASACFVHRRLTLLVWVLAVVGMSFAAGATGGEFAEGGRLPGTDSDLAYELLLSEAPQDPQIDGDTGRIVLSVDGRFDDPAVDAMVAGFLDDVAALPGVLDSPSTPEALLVSDDSSVATGAISLGTDDTAVVDELMALRADLAGEMTVDYSGYRFQDGGVPSTEAFGLLAAMVILLIAFGSLVAMGLPIITALFGIVIGLAGVELWAAAVSTPDFTVQVASMVGIGVGIDYALFIVTRYRESLKAGSRPHAAVLEAIDTAGRAVVFAGVTVMISLMGMLLMGMSFLNGLALGTSSAVLVAVLAAITLLPALLGFAGRRIDRLSVHRRTERTGESGWHRWSRFVQRHPVACAASGIALLGALVVPSFFMRFASADAGNDPAGTTTRLAYDTLADGFGAGYNGPLLLVTRIDGNVALAEQLAADVGRTEGVATVAGIDVVPNRSVAVITVMPTTGPQEQATADLVHRLRDDVIPAGGVTAHVGGQTAGDVDFSEQMSSRLPIFIGAVLVLSFLLLMVVFRSILVPLKAVLLNLMSIGAAYGVLVAVFQWGWFGWLIGVEQGAPIEPWAPMMLFAIVFGLSMDYEVFLLSSVKERVDRGESNSQAVVEGLASTARVITAAAAIMVCVFGTFVLGDIRAIKLIGLGLAVAVFLDATLVRMLLVPATMELLGDRNWWLPKRLARVLPVVHVDAPPHVEPLLNSAPAERPLAGARR
ncbi:MAG: MMPL family transporter [Actinomycetota bacterium]|nr:MMPL family transporter [Actinomycetota bacterium]